MSADGVWCRYKTLILPILVHGSFDFLQFVLGSTDYQVRLTYHISPHHTVPQALNMQPLLLLPSHVGADTG